MGKEDDGSWFGSVLLALPVVTVTVHLLFPDVFFLKLLANIVVLIAASILFAAMGEMLGGAAQFSLPFATILVVVVAGVVFFFKFGWLSTILVLVVYGGACAAGGLSERSRGRGPDSEVDAEANSEAFRDPGTFR